MNHINKFYEQFTVPVSPEIQESEFEEDVVDFDEIKDTFLLEDSFVHPNSTNLSDHDPVSVQLTPEDSDA